MLTLLMALVAQEPFANLGYVDVRGQRYQPLLTVETNTDAPLEALVISDPVSIRCGAARFGYDQMDAPRLCWIRRPTGTTITLTARLPKDGRIQWENCPSPTATTCTITVGSQDLKVRALFTTP